MRPVEVIVDVLGGVQSLVNPCATGQRLERCARALWHFLAVLQSESANRPPILADWMIATDTALTYARLANLATEQGLADRARVLLSKATEQCSRMRLKDCSADVILQMAKTPLPATR